jgi:hypothetical protein
MRKDGDLIAQTKHHRIRQGKGRLIGIPCLIVAGDCRGISRRRLCGILYSWLVTDVANRRRASSIKHGKAS